VRRTWLSLALFAALVLVWHFASENRWWPSTLFPSPDAVLRYMGRAVADGSLPTSILVTARRLAIGYLIGVVVGIPLGIFVARSKTCAATLGVVALGLQTLPSVCWVPLALLWFGQTEAAMLFVVVMGTVWSIVVATDNAIRTIPPIYVRAARTMGSRGLHTLAFVVLPASMPVVLSGMKQGWAFAWRSLMAAEIYVTIITGAGLGYLLNNGRELAAMDQVISIMLVIVVVGLAADKLLFAPAERLLRRRWGAET
jgi:sulfonate transport system permease protein